MRKISAQKLNKKYKVSDEKQTNIVTSVAATELRKSAKLLKEFVESQDGAKSDNEYAETVEKILNNHLTILKEVLKAPSGNKKGWKFVINRDRAGFIARVIATPIK